MTSEPWHLDKRVPLVLVFALLAQTLGVGWWAASIQSDLNTQKELIAELRAHRAAATMEERRISETLVRLDERIRAQFEILQRLERLTAGTGRQ